MWKMTANIVEPTKNGRMIRFRVGCTRTIFRLSTHH
jgi:hypothetical protein